MKLNLPTRVRAIIYTLFTIAAPIVVYLSVTGFLGANEVTLFTSLSTAVFGLAALNTDTTEEF